MEEERLVFAGIDEAGYGPLLGPLCLGICVLSMPASTAAEAMADGCRLTGHVDFFSLLAEAVTEEARSPDRRTAICDSKRLHDPNKLKPLEESVLTLHAAMTQAVPQTFRALLDEVSLTSPARLARLPWYAGEALTEALPVEALRERCELRGESLAQCLEACGVTLERIRVEPVEVPTFNGLLEEVATKADAELAVIASLLAKMWERYPRLRVVVDRLGARDYYRPMLEQRFPGLQVRTLAEAELLPPLPPLASARSSSTSKAKKKSPGKRSKHAQEEGPPRYSRYRVESPGTAELDVTFATEGERVALPVAVASLYAKYVRDGCMRALNRYWQTQVPSLRPTKGYVQDGRRFLADLEAALGTAAVDRVRAQLVRNR